jgi:hypothetical protein
MNWRERFEEAAKRVAELEAGPAGDRLAWAESVVSDELQKAVEADMRGIVEQEDLPDELRTRAGRVILDWPKDPAKGLREACSAAASEGYYRGKGESEPALAKAVQDRQTALAGAQAALTQAEDLRKELAEAREALARAGITGTDDEWQGE